MTNPIGFFVFPLMALLRRVRCITDPIDPCQVGRIGKSSGASAFKDCGTASMRKRKVPTL